MKKKKYIIFLSILATFIICFTFFYKKKYAYDAFFEAVTKGNLIELDDSLRSGIDINTQNYNGETALMLAVIKEKPSIVKILLKKGANPAIKNKSGNTAMFYAIFNGNYKMIKLLLNNGVPVNQYVSSSRTALHFAVQEGDTAIVKLLIDKGADVNKVFFKDITPLSIAASKGNFEIAKILINNGAKIDKKAVVNAHDTFTVNYKGEENLKKLMDRRRKIIELFKNCIAGSGTERSKKK